jgi:hypothetical protein
MKKVHLSLVLDSNQYHAGHLEICRHFEDNTSDTYLDGLVASLAQANNAIFAVMHIEEVRITIKQENRQLMDRLMATAGYLDSCKYVKDAAMRASASVLLQVFDSYSKPFARMKASERVGAMQTLLRDMEAPAMQEHVDRLPEMASRISGIREASETLQEALYQADKAKGTAPKGQSLMPLKREAAARLETLVDYLEAMAVKVPADYAEHLAVVMQIINRLNARRRSKSLQIEVVLEDDEEEEQQPALGA